MLTEPGTYFAKPEAFGTEYSEKGTPHVTIQLTVTHAASGDQWRPVINPFMRTVRLYMSPAAEPYTMKKLEALGFNGDFGEGMAFSQKTMEGIAIQCRHESYDGKQQERWDLAGGGPTEIKRASSDIIRTLNAKYRAKAQPKPAAPSRPVPPPPVAPSSPPPPPVSDLSIDPNSIPDVPVTPCTREEAWAAYTKDNALSLDELQADWASLLKREFPDKAEGNLTSKDWGVVRANCKIPF